MKGQYQQSQRNIGDNDFRNSDQKRTIDDTNNHNSSGIGVGSNPGHLNQLSSQGILGVDSTNISQMIPTGRNHFDNHRGSHGAVIN